MKVNTHDLTHRKSSPEIISNYLYSDKMLKFQSNLGKYILPIVPKFLDRQVGANSVDPVQSRSS